MKLLRILKKSPRTSESDAGANDSYNVLVLNADYDHDDEYDDCKDLADELNFAKEKSANANPSLRPNSREINATSNAKTRKEGTSLFVPRRKMSII